MRKSLITRLIEYADKKQLLPLTGASLFKLQNEAFKPTKAFLHEKERILKKHNYTLESWEITLQRAKTFYFYPDNKEKQVNKEIKALCDEYNIVNRAYQLNYFYALLSQAVKRKKVSRDFNSSLVYIYNKRN